MPRGFSLHIGINEVDQSHYGFDVPPLQACINDAEKMFEVADHYGYDSKQILRNHEATRDRVKHEVREVSLQMQDGDIFFLTFSGHGSQIPDAGNDPDDEDDGLDETWCLFDGQLLDDELRHLLAAFPGGSRVVVLSDSCHSGTAIHEWIHEFWGWVEGFMSGKNMRFRFLDEHRRKGVVRRNEGFYHQIKEEIRTTPQQPVVASVCSIAACQDNQRAVETPTQGAFTDALLIALGEQQNGNYRQLHREIFRHIRAIQSPHLFAYGPGVEEMLKSPAFVI